MKIEQEVKQQIRTAEETNHALSVHIEGDFAEEEIEPLLDLIKAYGIKLKLAILPVELTPATITLEEPVTKNDKKELAEKYGITSETHDLTPGNTIEVYLKQTTKKIHLILDTQISGKTFIKLPEIKKELEKLEEKTREGLFKIKIIPEFLEFWIPPVSESATLA